jgi:6-phosphogluconolactonase/glucosamine-6-phosphate isomerase/deaminase
VLVTGEDKAEALRRITSEPLEPRRLPGQLLLSQEALSHFFLDRAAAAGLE